MWHVWPLFLFSMATLAIATGGGLPATRQAELRNIVIQDCGSCHGLTLKGGLGKPLLPETLKTFPDAAVAEIILDGVSGTAMPPWRGLLTEAEALWIARTLKQEAIP